MKKREREKESTKGEICDSSFKITSINHTFSTLVSCSPGAGFFFKNHKLN